MGNAIPRTSMEPYGRTLDSVALRTAYAVRRMHRVLAWLLPVALCLASVGTAMFYWPAYEDAIGKIGLSDMMGRALIPWLCMFVFAPAYSLWNSRLMTHIISFYEGRGKIGGVTLMSRHLLGVLFLSGSFWLGMASGGMPLDGGGTPCSFVPWVVLPVMVPLLSSVPVIMAYLGSMCWRVFPRSRRQVVLEGVGMMVVTVLLYLLPYCIGAWIPAFYQFVIGT